MFEQHVRLPCKQGLKLRTIVVPCFCKFVSTFFSGLSAPAFNRKAKSLQFPCCRDLDPSVPNFSVKSIKRFLISGAALMISERSKVLLSGSNVCHCPYLLALPASINNHCVGLLKFLKTIRLVFQVILLSHQRYLIFVLFLRFLS